MAPTVTCRTRRSARAGVSLIEVVLAASILTLLARALVESATSMSRVTSSGNTQTVLQEQGEKALRAIIADLSRSGYTTVDGKLFPYVFTDGVADEPGFEQHGHPLPEQEAEEGDPDFGVLREIVLVQPADVDRDGRPDMDGDLDGTPELDGDGDGVRSESGADLDGWDPGANDIDPAAGLVWSHQEISYVVVTRPDGINYLERRVDADPDRARRIASDVERVQFDTWESSAWGIPVDSVRVQIFFRRRSEDGTLYRHRAEVVVHLRNG